MADRRALVLIPCCSKKQVSTVHFRAEPAIPGIEILRSGLQAKLRETLELASKPENRDGLLNEGAPGTPSCLMYQGRLFRPLSGLWDQDAVEILIVSAAYGLVKPGEAIKLYELQMGDRFADGQPAYRFWETAGLADLLESHVQSSRSSHVWSLLPDSYTSQSKTPYHRVFRTYWNRARKRGERCFWVKVFTGSGRAAGTGSGSKRGEWLAEVLRTKPAFLTQDPPSESELQGIPGFRFQYDAC